MASKSGTRELGYPRRQTTARLSLRDCDTGVRVATCTAGMKLAAAGAGSESGRVASPCRGLYSLRVDHGPARQRSALLEAMEEQLDSWSRLLPPLVSMD
jgi:hypothetical protein